MPNFYAENADLRYYVERGLDWEPLVNLLPHDGEFQSPAEAVTFYRDVLDTVGRFAAEEIAPRWRELDRGSPQLRDGEVVLSDAMQEVFSKIAELELHGVALPKELGGLNAPMLLYMLNSELFARGDLGVTAHLSFFGGLGSGMFMYSMLEPGDGVAGGSGQFDQAIREMLTGEACTCMDITEADAGSDMAAIATKAELDDDGQWFVTGRKIFITSGQGKYHIVIARDPGMPAGLKGLSLFFVKAYEETADGRRRDGVVVERLEDKMGQRCAAITSVAFDRAPAQLVGKRGDGFRMMLVLMNNARIVVGFEALGVCESAYELAKDYAAQRRSMGKTIDRHEIIADYLAEMRSDIEGIRALSMEAAYCEEMATKLEYMAVRPDTDTPEVRRKMRSFRRRARAATPLLKFIGAERAVETTRRCLQIHGGAGYTQDYQPEKLLRDSLVLPIYEGTSQIQALMVVKDSLGAILKKPADFTRAMAGARWHSLFAADPRQRRVARLEYRAEVAKTVLLSKCASRKLKRSDAPPVHKWSKKFLTDWDPSTDFAYALLHAERLTLMLADAAIARLLLDQAVRHEDRSEVLGRYLERAEPRSRYLLDQIRETGEALLADLQGSAGMEPLNQAAVDAA